MKETAAENHYVYLDYYSAMLDDKGILQGRIDWDGLHPNAAGYADHGAAGREGHCPGARKVRSMMPDQSNDRRGFLQRLMGAAGLAAAPAAAQAAPQSAPARRTSRSCPPTRGRRSYKSLKQSSYDRTGGNRDSWTIAPGAVQEVFNAQGPGVISHIWFTIAARSGDHLKELVLRGYWDGNAKPSVEAPVGDFFGLNLNSYFNLRIASTWPARRASR